MTNATSKAIPTTKTDCGKKWVNLKTGCYRCNPDGGHYHYSDGGCDLEPCERHGGPR